jgi:predicted  nucleic acid-binding Zn-ribbon protein
MPERSTSAAMPPDTSAHDEVAALRAELAATREALRATEGELEELRARRSTEMARLERQAYWLERADIDLDSLLRRPAFAWLARLAARVLRLLRRL